MKKNILILSILLSCTSVYATKSPLNDFYFIGEVPDSAAIGRGLAYAGVSGSPYAPYWNPAGLVAMKDNSMGVSFNVFTESDIDSEILKNGYPLQGRQLNFISVCSNQVGFYWRPLTDRVITTTGTVSGVDFEQTVEAKMNVFGISVAVPHTDKVDFGMNINFITGMIGMSRIEGAVAEVGISDGYGWGLDWGLIYKVSDRLNVGLTLLNGPGLIYWEDYDTDKLPPTFRVGIDIQLSQLMSLGIDYENCYGDGSIDNKDIYHFGVEQYVAKGILVRGGVYGSSDFQDKYKNVYTTGIGYKSEKYSLDIAARQYYTDSTKSTRIRRFSLSGVIPF
jgi:hypothetical protein